MRGATLSMTWTRPTQAAASGRENPNLAAAMAAVASARIVGPSGAPPS